jgi:hypothetical protein
LSARGKAEKEGRAARVEKKESQTQTTKWFFYS